MSKHAMSINHTPKYIFTCLLVLSLTACNDAYRPKFTDVSESMQDAMRDKKVAASVMAKPTPKRSPGSLWQGGSNHFFKDTRAKSVGDIVTIIVLEDAKAEVDANTDTTREHAGSSGISRILGLTKFLPKNDIATGVGGLFDTESNREFKGAASTDREDKLEARIAAMVVQVLPNGYLAVQGHREVMINYELQEMTLQGIIRHEDIASDNTIPSEKIAQARISYAGRGIVNESQQPKAGVRFLDKWMPF